MTDLLTPSAATRAPVVVSVESIDDRVYAGGRFAAAAARTGRTARWWCQVFDRAAAAETLSDGRAVWQRPRRGPRGAADQIRRRDDGLARGEQWCWAHTDAEGPVRSVVLVVTAVDPLVVWSVFQPDADVRTALRAVLCLREDLVAAWPAEGRAVAVLEVDLVAAPDGDLVDVVRTVAAPDPVLAEDISLLSAGRGAGFEEVHLGTDAALSALPRPEEASGSQPTRLGLAPSLTYATVGDAVVVHDSDRASVVDDGALWLQLADGASTTELPRSAFHTVGRWIDAGWVVPDPPVSARATTAPIRPVRKPVMQWNPVVCYRFAEVTVSVRYPSHAVARLVAPVLRSLSARTDAVDAALHVDAADDDRWRISGDGSPTDVVTWHQLPAAVRNAVVRAGQLRRTVAALPAAVVTDGRAAVAVVGPRLARAQLLDAWTSRGGQVTGDEAVVRRTGESLVVGGIRAGLELHNALGCAESPTPWGVARPLVGSDGRLVSHWQIPRAGVDDASHPLAAVCVVELGIDRPSGPTRMGSADAARSIVAASGWHHRPQDVGFLAETVDRVPCERWVVASGAEVADRVAGLLAGEVSP